MTRTPAAGESTPGPVRRPRQERGERRVRAILDAAAALLAESGTESLTVQALADRACTSKGSLYHFFPDLRAVLDALADRHAAAVTSLTAAIIADETIPWSRLPLDEVVDRFLVPFAYLGAHPDLLALARAPGVMDRTTRHLAAIRDLAHHILARRCDALPPERRLAVSCTMVALVDGIVVYGLRSDEVTLAQMERELRRALRAYLGALRRGVAGEAGIG